MLIKLTYAHKGLVTDATPGYHPVFEPEFKQGRILIDYHIALFHLTICFLISEM